jgi:hypothetical protein
MLDRKPGCLPDVHPPDEVSRYARAKAKKAQEPKAKKAQEPKAKKAQEPKQRKRKSQKLESEGKYHSDRKYCYSSFDLSIGKEQKF